MEAIQKQHLLALEHIRSVAAAQLDQVGWPQCASIEIEPEPEPEPGDDGITPDEIFLAFGALDDEQRRDAILDDEFRAQLMSSPAAKILRVALMAGLFRGNVT